MRNVIGWVLALVVAASGAGQCMGIATVSLKTTRAAVLNDGRDSTEIIAEARDSRGVYLADGTTVTFSTDLGTFAQAGTTATAQTRSGAARVRLSSQRKGTATVTAAVQGGGFEKCEVVFTDDASETVAGNSYISVQSAGSLVYCAGERVIEALKRGATDDGKLGFQASLTFRNVQISADTLQLDCTSNVVRANGAVLLRRGQRELHCGRLNYNVTSGQGYAVAEVDGRLRPVSIKGTDLQTTVQEKGILPSIFELDDLSEAKLVVSARQVLFFPGDKLQFKRPRFYQDGQYVFSMAFYTLPLYSSQLFSDQLLTVGSTGLRADVPFYYDMTPTSTGQFRLRYGEQVGRSSFGNRPGLSVDLVQSYAAGDTRRRFTGEFGLTGLNRTDWGFRWSHSQDFGGDTRGSAYIDLPQHRGIYGSSNLNKRIGNFSVGLTLSGNRSLTSRTYSGSSADAYVESLPRRLGKSGYSVAYGGTVSSITSVAGTYKTSGTNEGIQARFYSDAFKLDRRTTLTNYITLGHQWGGLGYSGARVVSSLALQHSLSQSATLQAAYDFTGQPGATAGGGRHRLNVSLGSNGGSKWYVMAMASRMLDTGITSLLADTTYNFARRWRVNFTATVQTFTTGSFRDYQVGISRSIGLRDIQLIYSTYSHRFFFDLQASRF